ncbi:11302_t:CDS:2, partial [Racocetra persica]
MSYQNISTYLAPSWPQLDPRLPIRDNIVAENDEGLSAILNNALTRQEDIPFIAVDFEGSSEKIGIQIFFDILVPDKEIIDEFKIKIDAILSSVINTYKIEYIKAFPLR